MQIIFRVKGRFCLFLLLKRKKTLICAAIRVSTHKNREEEQEERGKSRKWKKHSGCKGGCCWQPRTIHLMRIVMHTPKALYLNYRTAGVNVCFEWPWKWIEWAQGPNAAKPFLLSPKAHHLDGATPWYNQSRVLCLPIKLISLPHRIHKRVVNNSTR